MTKTHETTLYYRPGESLPHAELTELVDELRAVAETCFSVVPNYQCLEGSDESLADKVITVARRADGRVDGFCSAMLIPVPRVGEVLHLGLTCARPDVRGVRLIEPLTSRLVVEVMLRHRPLETQWISNVGCVLSNLGSVAQHFDAVHPSPFESAPPGPEHLLVAETIDRYYRRKIFIDDDATFDEEAFVFRGSVKGTVFQKDAGDERFHHRDPVLNDFYGKRMRFDQGDEVLQVGCVTAWSLFKYALGTRRKSPDKLPMDQVMRRWVEA